MTDLVVRRMSFQFDNAVSKVPFMWQPGNPGFAIYCNAFTFIAVPFEKYIIAAPDQPLPAWVDTWMREYDRGTDMTSFCGKG